MANPIFALQTIVIDNLCKSVHYLLYNNPWAIGNYRNRNRKHKVEMENGNGQIVIEMYLEMKPLFRVRVGYLLKTSFL